MFRLILSMTFLFLGLCSYGGCQTQNSESELKKEPSFFSRESVNDASVEPVGRGEVAPMERNIPPDTTATEQVVEASPEEQPEVPSHLGLLDNFFDSHGGRSAFSPHYVQALTTFFEVEYRYDQGQYKEGQDLLAKIWQQYPKGDAVWWRAGSSAKGTNVGNPVAYYGLRMLEEMLRFQLSTTKPAKSTELVLTVVLADCLQGTQATTMKELEEGKGKNVTLKLQSALRHNQYAVVKESLKLFRQYVLAITGGRLSLSVELVEISSCVTGKTTAKPLRTAGLHSVAELWPSIPAEVKRKTSWWWVIYPSLVPNQYPDFKTTEFITGGMGVGPNANSPCFIVDDQWLLRKPPHLGQGAYSSLERRVYLPQWLQHEFFHHLFRIYPSFGLEKTGHQWFDRKTWPSDFVGSFEPDYYAEALAKRLQTGQAKPPMHIHLRYEEPPVSLYKAITENDILGTYLREPKTNNWHQGTIERSGGSLRWKNLAGVSWTLTLEPNEGGLLTGPTCPYRNTPGGRIFKFALQRDKNGNYTPKLLGFYFNGELYRRLP